MEVDSSSSFKYLKTVIERKGGPRIRKGGGRSSGGGLLRS